MKISWNSRWKENFSGGKKIFQMEKKFSRWKENFSRWKNNFPGVKKFSRWNKIFPIKYKLGY